MTDEKDQIFFNIDSDLKTDFQIICFKEKSNMTKKIVEMISDYVKQHKGK